MIIYKWWLQYGQSCCLLQRDTVKVVGTMVLQHLCQIYYNECSSPDECGATKRTSLCTTFWLVRNIKRRNTCPSSSSKSSTTYPPLSSLFPRCCTVRLPMSLPRLRKGTCKNKWQSDSAYADTVCLQIIFNLCFWSMHKPILVQR